MAHYVCQAVRTPTRRVDPDDLEREVQRLYAAVRSSSRELTDLAQRLEGPEKEESGAILEAHQAMLRDPLLLGGIEELVRAERINAEWAVERTTRRLAEELERSANPYLAERREDIQFVGEQLERQLMGREGLLPLPDTDTVVVAEDVSPEDIITLSRTGRVRGFVLERGSPTSHAAIALRALSLPAVVGVRGVTRRIASGEPVWIDGTRGLVGIGEEPPWFAPARVRVPDDLAPAESEPLPAATVDGVLCRIFANIEFLDDVLLARRHGANGIGLFRTEFLLLGRADAPDEEQQYRCYRQAAEWMTGRVVTLRTFDVGGDKGPRFGRPQSALESAMGVRGVRHSLQHRDLFRAQLRAMVRASAHGTIRVMFPLVSDVTELRQARHELESCREELAREGVPTGDVQVGIMVETPSAVLALGRLAREVDFVSVGTNDLIQFLFAIDRRNRDVAHLYRPLHPSVLAAMANIAAQAARAKITASVCGEMASDPLSSVVLVALGFPELSVPPRRIAAVREAIRRARHAAIVPLVDEAMEMDTAEEVEHFLSERLGIGAP